MGLIVQIKNIQSPNNFKLFYRTGRTPGSSSEQSSSTWGTQYTGGTSVSGVFSVGTTTITIDLMDPTYLIDSNPYGKQYWFKILDLVTGSYIIENIYIHDISFYTELCATPTPTPTPTATPDCTFTGGSAVTDAPTPTPTSTIIIDCTFTGGSALVGPTPTPTSTVIVQPTPTPTSTTVPPPTPTPTSTLNECVEITEELLFEDLGCGPGVRNRYLEYTITYKVNGVATSAPQDITFTVNTDQGGTTTYTEILPVGQSTTTLTGVYTLVWIGEDCLNKNSESYSVTSTGLTPSYEICTVVPPPPTPTPTPTSLPNTTWYFTHGAGLYAECTASYLEILRNGSQVVLSMIDTGSEFGSLNLNVGDQLVIRVNTGQAMGYGCQNAYVKYDSQQLVEDSETGYNNAEINVTVTQLDIQYGITICGTIGGGICPV